MTTLISTREARALREDAQSSLADTARKRIEHRNGRQARCTAPHRVRIRIGSAPDYEGMNREDFLRSVDLRKVYRSRRPRCRACGGLIDHGTNVIAFFLWGGENGSSPTNAFIHEECPVKAS